mmetsp:Transcript_113588/g.316313  ORF Transcript_113588/g.316313 Transcript_113588/m.316313 type:complete len:202 (-) Transcript_113588:320-925(-)
MPASSAGALLPPLVGGTPVLPASIPLCTAFPPVTAMAAVPGLLAVLLPAPALPPPSAAVLLPFGLLRPAALEVEVREVDLAAVDALPHGALCAVFPCAYAVARLQVSHDLLGVTHVILLEAEPQGVSARRAHLVCSGHDGLHPLHREVVVRKVHLLNGTALLDKVGESLCANIVDVIPEELQHSQLLTAEAQVQDLPEALG